MGSQLSVKVKAKGRQAERLARALAATPDASGANYVSPSRLFVPPGATPGTPRGAERVPYKPASLLDGDGVASPAVVPEAGPTAASRADYAVPGPARRRRRELNKQRDNRTNLGRGKGGIVEVEG